MYFLFLYIRRSIRQFKEGAIAPDIITRIIGAEQWTPSGGDAQRVSYIVLQKDIAKYEKVAMRFAQRLLPLAKMHSLYGLHLPLFVTCH